MNPNKRYMHSHNTVGYLTISKQMPIYKRTPTKKKVENNFLNNIYSNNNIKNNGALNEKTYLISKYVSRKKYQGVLDMSSPGNKDVIIDSDSEIPSTIDIKNDPKKNNIFKKNKCAKLVIEKVESKTPEKNEEYYKFTNQKRENKTIVVTKKNFNNKYLLRFDSSIKLNKTDKRKNNNKFNVLTQSQIISNSKNQFNPNYQEYNNDKIKKQFYNSSATNFYKGNKIFYDTRYSYNNSQSGYKNKIINNDNSLITKSPAGYIKTIEDNSMNIIENSPNEVKNYIYENDISPNEIYNQESINPNQINNMKYYYIYKNNNNNVYRNRDIGEESKKSTLYENYKDLIKMNIFSKLSCNNNRQNTSKIILYPELKEKLIKIQSAWRGVYVRELMTFYWNLENFKKLLNKVFNNNLKKNYFLFFINRLKKYQNHENKKIIINDNTLRQKYKSNKRRIIENDDKRLEEYIKALNQKEQDYDNLLKNYNSLVERCTELQQIVNQSNENNNNNNYSIESKKNKNKNDIWKELNITKNGDYEMILKEMKDKEKDNEKKGENNTKTILKKYDIIKPEQKDKFDIIQKNRKINDDNNNEENKKLKPQQNSINKQTTIYFESKTNKTIENYYPSFKSNLYIVKVANFNIKDCSINKDRKFQIFNNELSIINKIKIPSLKEICHNESINIIYNENKKPFIIQIYNNESFSFINNKNNISLIREICNNESIHILSSKLDKTTIKEICNNELIFIPGKIIKKYPILEINNNEPISILRNKEEKSSIKEICNNESISILVNKEKNISIKEICKIESISILGNKIEKQYIKEICNNDSLSILVDKEKKSSIKMICQNEQISLINNNMKRKLFDINKIYKENCLEITITNSTEKINDIINSNKHELIQENQNNLNIEIKGVELKQTKNKIFKDLIVNAQNNDINIIQEKKIKKFIKDLMSLNKVDTINIINEKTIDKKINIQENMSKVNIEQFMIGNNNNINKCDYNNNNIICDNERFSLIKGRTENKNNNNNNNLTVEKKDEILLAESNINKNKKLDIEFTIDKNNNLFIKRIKKSQCDKITEITEELNRIEPNNHYELIFEGIINLNEDIVNKNNMKAINPENNITNNNKIIIDNNKQEFSFMQNDMDNDKNKVYISNNNNPNRNINYNINNEIDKCNALEINPFEIKRTKNNTNNIFISHENKLEVLYNNNSVFTEKAKKNMMKIILPIRLKTTLREFIHRSIFPLLINKLRKIAFASHLNKIEDKIEKDLEKVAIEKIKNNVKSKFYKNYYAEQMKKKEINNILYHYAVYKWNKLLYDISKELINNKTAILEMKKNK